MTTTYRLPVVCLLLAVSLPAWAGKSGIQTAGDYIQIIIPATAYLSTYTTHSKEGRTQFYQSFFTSLAVTHGLKLIVDKDRPDGSDNNSFPSGHTAAAFQGAGFIQKRYGWRYGLPAYALASFVGYSRVYAKKHYLEDVLAGAAISLISCEQFTTRYKRKRLNVGAHPSLMGVSFRLSWQ